MTEGNGIIWYGPTEARPFLIAISNLKHDADNANQHPPENLKAIANSLKEFGQDQFCVVRRSDMSVIKGNGRLESARDILKWTHLACILVDDDKARSIARSVADNRTSELSKWDYSILSSNFQAIEALDVDITNLGFDQNFYDQIIGWDNGIEAGNADQEWQGMPDVDSEEPCFAKVVVNFDTAEDREKFFGLVNQKHTDKTKSIWYPEKAPSDLNGSEFKDE